MKKIFYAIILIQFSSITLAQITKVDLQVAGLTCSMCSKATDKQLRTLDFIDTIEINLSHAIFTLHFKKDKTVDFNQIKKKVENAGFSVTMLEALCKLDNLKIENNFQFNYENIRFCFIDVKPQTLNGQVALRIIDKGFISDKEYKKHRTQLSQLVTNTDKIASHDGDIYHVTLKK